MSEIIEHKITGWIKLYRSLSNIAFYKKSEYVHLWIHLLIKCNHKPIDYLWNGNKIILIPGQYITGRKQLSEHTGISESSVERILNYLEQTEQQIQQQKTNKSRLISIRYWNDYQEHEQQPGQQMDNKRTTDEQQMDNRWTLNNNVNNNNNEKNVKNEKKELIFPFTSENFKNIWDVLLQEKKWKKKSKMALQASLKKLSEHSEHDAIKMIENTIAGEWQGIFELNKNKNGKQQNSGSGLAREAYEILQKLKES